MAKKRGQLKIVIFVVILLVLIGVLFYVFYPRQYYTDNPKDWVEKGSGDVKEVNIDKVTKGTGFIDEVGQQLRYEEISTVFDIEGFYQGNFFTSEYSDETGKAFMRITSELDPTDGVIDGFMVEKIEGDQPVVYIFLDEDWKKALPVTNIFWGVDYAREKAFDFTPVEKGVYMNKIIDDKERFSDDYKIHRWGVVVGDMTREDTVDKTLLRLV